MAKVRLLRRSANLDLAKAVKTYTYWELQMQDHNITQL